MTELQPNTQITPETVGMLKAGDRVWNVPGKWLGEFHGVEDGLILVSSVDDGPLQDAYDPASFTYQGPAASSPPMIARPGSVPMTPEMEAIMDECMAASSPSAVGGHQAACEAPGHTDLMISPEAIDAFLSTGDHPEISPTPAPSAGDATVDWERVGPKLVEAGLAFEVAVTADIPVGDGYAEWVETARNARADFRDALAAATPGGK